MSNSKLMRFNIFMNFDREFSTHWLNKAPLFATLFTKICTHLGFLQPLPLWPAKWLNQSQGCEWGWGLCSLPALSWQTSVGDEEMLSHSPRERNWSPPQCQSTPSFCDRAVHTQLFSMCLYASLVGVSCYRASITCSVTDLLFLTCLLRVSHLREVLHFPQNSSDKHNIVLKQKEKMPRWSTWGAFYWFLLFLFLLLFLVCCSFGCFWIGILFMLLCKFSVAFSIHV